MAPMTTKDDVIKLIYRLASDRRDNPEQWENRDLSCYLEAMASWIEDMDGFYENTGRRAPGDISWSVLADILQAAKIYE
ncbi:hypothetical protein FJU30_15045 [Affinibrenneria salicis]|uniref:DUF7660 domain-containing protein n=2 Tax=Affinibrenneria salicis TaxID=2590031 RepID=A0A5J5FZ52_9GAMM|nr:hypothetical protein FJU30_15045 [Affinibrenneria salicis]